MRVNRRTSGFTASSAALRNICILRYDVLPVESGFDGERVRLHKFCQLFWFANIALAYWTPMPKPPPNLVAILIVVS